MASSSSVGFDIREAVDSLREAFTPRGSGRGSGRGSHGDVRGAILLALGDEPMNGQQVIRAITAKSGWAPSAGAVYPTLQLLTDEGLVSAKLDGERTVYSLTDAGREAAAASASASSNSDSRNEWSMPRMGDRFGERWNERFGEHTAAVPKAGAKLAQAAAQVAQSGSREQNERAAAILDDARRKLYAILAED